MVSTPHTISGKVFKNDGITAIESVSVNVLNRTTGESHSGSDAGFEDLKTDEDGEYSTNLGSFTDGYSDGDLIKVSASHPTHGKDEEITTVAVSAGGEVVNLVLANDEVLMVTDNINELGQTVDHRRTVATYEEGTIETETNTDTTMTVIHDIVSDNRRLMEWGEVKEGRAIGFFKGKEDIVKGDLIRVPRTTGDWWRVDDVPHLVRVTRGQKSHFEAELVRIDG